ncbi:MAG TPA: hypothetical protein VML96_01595 [Egibacteraceae bacterium]|nr:hypothetical protein [Egibacteraceae bacterium]
MTRTHHARTAAAIALVAATLSSCTSDPQPTAAPTSTVTAVATPTPTLEPTLKPASPTATPTPTPSVSVPPGNEPPPPLELVGEDFEAIVRSFEAYRSWALSNPAPGLLRDIYHDDCPCMEQERLLAHYNEEGLRWIGEPLTVISVDVVDQSHPNTVILRVVYEGPEPSFIINADGEILENVDPDPRFTEDDVFVREDSESPWQLIDFVDHGPVDIDEEDADA